MSIYYRSILGNHYFQTSVDNFQYTPDCLVHHCSNLNKSFLFRCSIAKCLPRIMNNLEKSRLMCSSDSFSNFEFWICQFCWRIFFYDYFFNWQTQKKNDLDQKGICFLFQLLKLEKFVDKIGETNWWKHLMNSFITYNK